VKQGDDAIDFLVHNAHHTSHLRISSISYD